MSAEKLSHPEENKTHSVDVYRLSDLYNGPNFFKESAESVIHSEISNEETESIARKALKAIVDVPEKRGAVCIDGRECSHTSHGQDAEVLPMVAGGNLLTLWVGLEITKPQLYQDIAQEDSPNVRIEKLANIITSLPENDPRSDKLAAHESILASDDSTECGAGMALVASLDLTQRHADGVEAVTSAASGVQSDDFELAIASPAGRFAQELQDEWHGKQLSKAVEKHGGAIEYLHSDHSSTHYHQEQMIILNHHPKTSYDRDAYRAQDNPQIFWVDMWKIDQLAEAWASDETERDRLVQAMTAFQVSTAASLTDGSLPIVTFKENPNRAGV